MVKVIKLIGRQIFDARGNPTVEAEITLSNGGQGIASVPSGASVGQNEAVEMRDSEEHAYGGMGVLKAVNSINTVIRDSIIGNNINFQDEIDDILIKLDNTHNKTRLGANSILAVSLAFAKAFANGNNIHLFASIAKNQKINNKSHMLLNMQTQKESMPKFAIPTPMLNIINGGRHADNSLDIQEFMIVPTGAKSIIDQLKIANEVSTALKKLLLKKNLSVNVGDEGGFAPELHNTYDAMNLLRQAIEISGYSEYVGISLDIAASELWDGKYYRIDNQKMSSYNLLKFYDKLLDSYPEIISIEDPFAENDFTGWKEATSYIGKRVLLVGDDLFVTNASKLQEGIKDSLANSILIKPNQIGSLSETIKTIDIAKNNGYTIILSHRSGETEDVSIAHIAVAVSSPYIKAGALCRGERVAKYNELLRINELLSDEC